MQTNTLTIRQARLQGRDGLWQLTIENGRFSRIESREAASLPQGEVLDAEGGLAIPPFVEPHIHLDTTQTAGEPSWNQSGTLFEGIERWAERKSDADSRRREDACHANPEMADGQRHPVCSYAR